MSTPFDDLIPQQSVNPFSDLTPHNRHQGNSVSSIPDSVSTKPGYNDAGVANGPKPMTSEQSQMASMSPEGYNDYMPPEVNAAAKYGTSQTSQQPFTFKKYATGILNLANLGMGKVQPGGTPESQAMLSGIASPGILAAQGLGKLGATSIGNAAQGAQEYTKQLIQNNPVAGIAYSLGQALPQTALYEASGLGGVVGKAASSLASKTLPTLQGITPTIARMGIQGATQGAAFGTLAGATSPIDNPEAFATNYINNIAKNTLGGAALGGILGTAGVLEGGLSLLKPTPTTGTSAAIHSDVGYSPRGSNASIPSIKDVTNDIMDNQALIGHPAIAQRLWNSETPTISDIEDAATSGSLEAKNTLTKLRGAAALEHGTNGQPIRMSLGDLTQDPQIQQTENQLQGNVGSGGNKMRAQQGAQIETAIANIHRKVLGEFAGTGGVDISSPTPIESQINQAVQNELKKVYQNNLLQSTLAHNQLFGDVDAAATPQNPNRVDTQTTLGRIQGLITDNAQSIAQDPQVINILKQIQANLANPQVDNSVRGVKSAVTDLESQIEGLKSGQNPNRTGARVLSQIKDVLDNAADDTASSILGDSDRVKEVSDFHKNNVVPFRNNDTGLPQIINGTYADKATKSFLSTASPDQFRTITSTMDEAGKSAIKLKLMEAARDFATNDGASDFNIQRWADFLAKRSEELNSVFSNKNDLNSLQGLLHLIQSAPNAGKLVSTNLGIGHFGRMSVGGLAGMVLPGGPLTGIAAEVGGEVGLNAMRGQKYFNPDIGSTINKSVGAMAFRPEEMPNVVEQPVNGPQGEPRPTFDAYAEGQYGNGKMGQWGDNQRPKTYDFSKYSTTTQPTNMEDLNAANQVQQAARETAASSASQARELNGLTAQVSNNPTVESIRNRIKNTADLGSSYWNLENGVNGYNQLKFNKGEAPIIRPYSQPEPTMGELIDARKQLYEQVKELQNGGTVDMHGGFVFDNERPQVIANTLQDIKNLDAHIGQKPMPKGYWEAVLNDQNYQLQQAIKKSVTSGGGDPTLANRIAQLTHNVDMSRSILESQTADYQKQFGQIQQGGVNKTNATTFGNMGASSAPNPGGLGGGEGYERPRTASIYPKQNVFEAPYERSGAGIINSGDVNYSEQNTTPTQSLGAAFNPIERADQIRNQINEMKLRGQDTSQLEKQEAALRRAGLGQSGGPFNAAQNQLDEALRAQQNIKKGVIPSQPTPSQAQPTAAPQPPKTPLEVAQATLNAANTLKSAVQQNIPSDTARETPFTNSLYKPAPESPTGLMSKLKAFLGIGQQQTTQAPNIPTVNKANVSEAQLVDELIKQHPELTPYANSRVEDITQQQTQANKNYTSEEIARAANDAMGIPNKTGQVAFPQKQLIAPRSPADISGAKIFVQGYMENTKAQQAEYADALSEISRLGATPEQIAQFQKDQAAHISARNAWSTKAMQLIQAGKDDEFVIHLKGKP